MRKRVLKRVVMGLAGVVVGIVAVVTLGRASIVGQSRGETYARVTDERLLAPAPDDWLMYRRTYDSWGYSPLDQITAANVGDLVPLWTFSTGVVSGRQSPPIVTAVSCSSRPRRVR